MLKIVKSGVPKFSGCGGGGMSEVSSPANFVPAIVIWASFANLPSKSSENVRIKGIN